MLDRDDVHVVVEHRAGRRRPRVHDHEAIPAIALHLGGAVVHVIDRPGVRGRLVEEDAVIAAVHRALDPGADVHLGAIVALRRVVALVMNRVVLGAAREPIIALGVSVVHRDVGDDADGAVPVVKVLGRGRVGRAPRVAEDDERGLLGDDRIPLARRLPVVDGEEPSPVVRAQVAGPERVLVHLARLAGLRRLRGDRAAKSPVREQRGGDGERHEERAALQDQVVHRRLSVTEWVVVISTGVRSARAGEQSNLQATSREGARRGQTLSSEAARPRLGSRRTAAKSRGPRQTMFDRCALVRSLRRPGEVAVRE